MTLTDTRVSDKIASVKIPYHYSILDFDCNFNGKIGIGCDDNSLRIFDIRKID